MRDALTLDGKLYALPFYAESAMTYYRKDLFEKAGLTMPDAPTYDADPQFADKLTDKASQIYGMCLRGKPGWGENMAYVTTLVDADGRPMVRRALEAHDRHPRLADGDRATTSDMLKADGPPGASSNGFNENLALFATGHCAMWIDATVAGGMLFDTKQSQVADKVGFAPMPTGSFTGGPTWLWSGTWRSPPPPSRRTRPRRS